MSARRAGRQPQTKTRSHLRVARHQARTSAFRRIETRPTRRELPNLPLFDEPAPLTHPAPPNAFVDYVRFLTAEGGIMIIYKDLDVRLRFTVWRVVSWLAFTSLEGWLIFYLPFSSLTWRNLVALLAAGLLNWLIVRKPIEVMRSIEVRPDSVIIEGTDVFWLEMIGDNWPSFRPDEGDAESQVLCGIYGTRFVEYVTSHRVDENDRTPEVLAMHLTQAMEQLWGRSELLFDG